MRYKKDLKACFGEMFKRFTGVKRMTFIEITLFFISYKENQLKGFKRGSRPSKLSIEDQLLMLLMYYQAYRTFLYISKRKLWH